MSKRFYKKYHQCLLGHKAYDNWMRRAWELRAVSAVPGIWGLDQDYIKAYH